MIGCFPVRDVLWWGRFMHPSSRPSIYQLFVRLYGNDRVDTVCNGSLEQNGCGKFNDINDEVLIGLVEAGFTHVWLTGVLEQASGTAYPGRSADHSAVLKGKAGSPYAIRDYFDVCPDYAEDPARRREEFRALLDRCRAQGIKPLIDFVPNHVARTYGSDVRPEHSFGEGDDASVFFKRDNHFFYLRPEDPGDGPPLHLPVGDGLFDPELKVGKVTGNNVISWRPSIFDWYETIKLNYGHDFTTGRETSHLPGPDADPAEVPKTWRTMDEVLAYWQEMGVAGFRVDMAHMVPMEFWRWMIRRCRARNAAVYFFGEAYDSDPMKLTEGDVLSGLLEAGFDAVYDHPVYQVLKELYESGKWANDLDDLTISNEAFHRCLRYAENHDEVRLASPLHWGGVGMNVGRPVSAVLLAMGRGPIMLYNGQEVGEPAISKMGFGGGDGRTSIFDYGTMPEMVKWRRGELDPGRQELRAWYVGLLHVLREPAFTCGEFYGLNHANLDNPSFGRMGDETVSGHWLYAFLRYDAGSGQAFLVVANFHLNVKLENVRVRIPDHARHWLDRENWNEWILTERFPGDGTISVDVGELAVEGIALPDLPPCSAVFFEIE